MIQGSCGASRLAGGIAALAVASSACGALFGYPEPGSEQSVVECRDGKDNDLDGDSDCSDSACRSHAHCLEAGPSACHDGIDNDLDDVVDCADPACAAYCEVGRGACGDRLDNDGDGRRDCSDDDCADVCSEATLAECSDSVDNDRDELSDTADPGCWPLFPPEVLRCAASAGTAFVERFDESQETESFLRWFAHGSFFDPNFARTRNVAVLLLRSFDDARRDAMASFVFHAEDSDHELGDGGLGGLVSRRSFEGPLSRVALEFSALVPRHALLRIGLVPENLAPDTSMPAPGTASYSVLLDGTVEPPQLSLEVLGRAVASAPLPLSDPSAPDDSALRPFRVSTQDRRLIVTTGDSSLESRELEATQIPRSRLVVWGGSDSAQIAAFLDDIALTFAPEAPCGVTRQIPASLCGVTDVPGAGAEVGRTVSVARQGAVYCVVTTGSGQVVSWTSPDGAAFDRGEATDLPDAEIVGAAVASDGERFRRLIARRVPDGGEVAVTFDSSEACDTWTRDAGELLLPLSAEAPSYVITPRGHDVYVTLPPTPAVGGRTLWRASASDGEAFGALEPLGELPEGVAAPVSIQSIADEDLVLVHPTVAGDVTGAGIGLLVGGGDGRAWQRVGAGPLLDPTGLPGFDERGVVSAALSWSAASGARAASGFFLYGGLGPDGLTAGTALVAPRGFPFEPSREPAICARGCAADPAEGCSVCAEAGCECPRRVLLNERFDGNGAWHRTATVESDFSAPSLVQYENPARSAFEWSSLGGAQWTLLPLPQAIHGDFELAFDLVLGSAEAPCEAAYIGLAERPNASVANPTGVFARLGALSEAEASSFLLGPFVRLASGETLPRADSSTEVALTVMPDVRQRVVLRKENGEVRVVVGDRCGAGLSYRGALPPLENIVVGSGRAYFDPALGAWASECFGLSASVHDLQLRLLDDPEACGHGKTLCGDGATQPSCADTERSPEHCGACGSACGHDARCADGECVCEAGRLECGEACVDPFSDRGHCGGCGVACGEEPCLAGHCGRGETCDDAIPLGDDEQVTVRLDLAQAGLDVTTICGAEVHRADVVFSWTAPSSGHLTVEMEGVDGGVSGLVSVTGTLDGAVCAAFDACGGAPVDLRGGTRLVGYPVTAGGTYYVVAALIGVDPGSNSRVELSLELQP